MLVPVGKSTLHHHKHTEMLHSSTVKLAIYGHYNNFATYDRWSPKGEGTIKIKSEKILCISSGPHRETYHFQIYLQLSAIESSCSRLKVTRRYYHNGQLIRANHVTCLSAIIIPWANY